MSWIAPYIPIVLEAVLVIGIVFIGFKIYKKFRYQKNNV